jgi:MFS family permease
LALFTGASLACGLAWSSGGLVAFRLLQGAGAALMVPQVLNIVQLHFDGPARARALSAYAAVIAGGIVAGQIAGGVRWIEEAIRRVEGWGNETIPAVGHMILGEMHLRMVTGGPRPPLRVLLRNLRFLLFTVPSAAARARRHLEQAIRIARAHDVPAVLARALYDLGRLCQATRRPDEARVHLDEALGVAAPLDLPVLTAQIRGVRS